MNLGQALSVSVLDDYWVMEIKEIFKIKKGPFWPLLN